MKTITTIIAAVLLSGCASWQPDYAVSPETSAEIVKRKAQNAAEISQKILSPGATTAEIEIVTAPSGQITETVVRGDQDFARNVISIMRPMPAHTGEENIRYTIPLEVR